MQEKFQKLKLSLVVRTITVELFGAPSLERGGKLVKIFKNLPQFEANECALSFYICLISVIVQFTLPRCILLHTFLMHVPLENCKSFIDSNPNNS
jgi:hypothetical protein